MVENRHNNENPDSRHCLVTNRQVSNQTHLDPPVLLQGRTVAEIIKSATSFGWDI